MFSTAGSIAQASIPPISKLSPQVQAVEFEQAVWARSYFNLREGLGSSMGGSIDAREVLVERETLAGTSGGLLREKKRRKFSWCNEE